ncbi:NACHT, LRR and PYD domains-containing protein 1b allele 2-like isoform X6 [Carassius carassius]|uniref:NACHT, LRR and PYD domains-containing protein 1b allele 2-like isoform X6 n=1 Tax=Carassius carassius TaxID=217509 RepID=UPI002868DC33|nr:NACHT, LRR and PYD domains-containing protein 1b allele 2-like isoform X6 [Carassius carassius]
MNYCFCYLYSMVFSLFCPYLYIISEQSMDTPVSFTEKHMSSNMSRDSQLEKSRFKSNLLKKFERLYEGTGTQGNPTLLNEIYTELYITESESGEINNDHEVRQIETQSRRAATEDTSIKCNDIFRPLPGQDKVIRTVLTKGVAGIGKTVSVQKLILDWAEGKENQDVHFIFPLPFREINLMKDKTLSLSDLLHVFFPETKEIEISSDEYKVLFIFDGLDECRLSLDFKSKVKLCNISESVSVDVLLMNLIVGNLLPSALIWITSRPAAADLVPSECVHRVTEVRGFNDPQKEEYFRKRISDQSLANTIISHLKSSRSLYIMCHIPVFCWISAAVLEKMLSQTESGEIPKTLTQMYTHFLIIQTKIKHEKDYKKTVKDEDMILKLGKLAFEQLVKGNLIFYEEDLRTCGIDETEAAVYSGLCTQIFREESGLYQGKVFCFVHLSLQEHLAALYAHLSFTRNYRNVFDQTKQSVFSKILNRKKYVSLSQLHKRVVDESLRRKNGHLDLFLRFLLGLSLESNQTLLRELLTKTGRCSYNKDETVEFIKQKIRANHSPERSINLFHCLNELGDDSLMQEIQDYLRSGQIGETKLSSSQWSALVYVLLTSEQKMDEFNLKQFIGAQNTADEVLQKLLPVIKESRLVQLYDCGVTYEGCAALASALRSNPSHLRELNLTGNKLGEPGVKLLSDLLKDPRCKLETLWLSDCGVTDEGCAALGLALRSNPSHLRELNLTGNKLGPSGVNLFSNLKDDPHYKLETLDHNFQLIQRMLKSNLRKKSECMYEGTAMQRNPTLLNEIYTELYITESESGEINNDHEVRQIETHSRRAATEDTAIKCSEIFRALPGQDKAIRTVMTKGVAGIGKTVSVQKLILDWAEGKENQDVQLIFPLPFREINLMKDKTLSLSDLLHVFFPETKEMELSSNEYKVLFIFDGLDECRLSLDFKSKVKLCNISESVSVDVLLMNLIVGNLLPSALIWITSRPAAADLVPSECVHRVTEVQGFNDPQKEEYFRKRISDQSLADRIISHLKSSRSLYIMCHIPVFCWISAAVLEKMLSRAESGEIPTTLTQMYTHFLILQTNIKHEKDYEKTVKDEDMILKLGKLAFQQLVKGNLTFYEEDLRECGIDETEAAVYLGLCPQIFREESGLFQGKVFYFVHLSIQEHLAALYAHLSFTKNYRNVFDQTEQSLFTNVLNRKKYKSISHLHQRAVDEALRSKNGHLDLFLRFLLGLSLESNQTLLRELLTQTRSGSYNKEETLEFIKQKIRRNHSSERCINLFHCLNELEDNSLMQEIQDYLSSGRIRETKLSSSQWTALVYVLLISEQKMDEFNLRQCIGARNTADEVLQKLLPVIKESRSVQLSDCGVTDEGCASLASALRSNSSHLRKLDLTGNKLGASGVKLLSDVLQNSRCKLEKLRLDVSEPSELNHPLPVCQSCVHIGDSDQWVQVEPSVCTDEGGSVFRISTPAGRFECSRTRLRWVCAGDVTLQYRAVDGRFLSAELERLQCERIGPVIDVTVISGKLEEAHLPHYACLAESDPSLKDDIKVLSVEEEGMFLESVELTRFHAKILQPYFSPKTVLMKLGITVKVHCDLLIFMTNKDPIILHLYFFPVDSVFEEKIKKERKMSNQINLSRPETPLQMNKQHSLEVPGAFVQPKEIKIRGDIKPNFFEVILSVADDIDMTLSRVDDKKSVWTAKVCKALFQTGQKSPQVAVNFDKVTFFDENWSDFIKHIKNVSAIADKLRQKKIIHEELYTEISLPTSTSEASMRKICSAVRKGSDTVKKMFISILLAEEPNLLSHLPSPDS